MAADGSTPLGSGRAALVPKLPIALHGLVDVGHPDCRTVSVGEREMAEVEVRIGDARVVAGAPRRPRSELRSGGGPSPRRPASRPDFPPRPGPKRGPTRWSEPPAWPGLLRELTAIRHLPESVPEAPEGARQTQSEGALPGVDRPSQRRPEVDALRCHAIEPFDVVRHADVGIRLHGKGEIRLCVTFPDVSLEAICGQPVQGKRLDRPEHAESSPARHGRRRDDQALVGEFE